MAIQTINLGNIVNDGLGDDLRTAFQKVNANFVELSTTSSTTASNTGSIGVGVFKQKAGADLQFKKIASGNKITVTDSADAVIITNDQADAFTQITTNSGIARASENVAITVQGGTNIRVSAVGSVLTVGEIVDTVKLISDLDFGPIGSAYENTIQFILASGDYDFGTWEQPNEITYDAGAI
jgi:hypothetical protein